MIVVSFVLFNFPANFEGRAAAWEEVKTLFENESKYALCKKYNCHYVFHPIYTHGTIVPCCCHRLLYHVNDWWLCS